MPPTHVPASHHTPLIGIDITARDDCFRGIRIAIRARQQDIAACRLRYIDRRSDPEGRQRCHDSLAECDGIITFASSNEQEEELAQFGVPVINVSARLLESRFPRVLTDHRAMGRIAAESLIARGLHQLITWEVSLGYVHWRSQGIRDAVAAAEAQLYCQSSLKDYALKLIAQLGEPLGIIGSNDQQARKVIEVLRAQGWDIPRQIAVIGMDNDSQVCEISEVPITSVGIDTLRWGSTALDTMLAILQGHTPPQPIIWIPPLGVVERESTARDSSDGAVISSVQQLLKQERALSWSAQDLALQAGVSKATLVRHCRDTLGTTPHQLLHQARLRKAEILLRDSSQTIASIAKRCGWKAPTRMVIAFQNAHGMSPSAYRNLQRNRGSPVSGI